MYGAPGHIILPGPVIGGTPGSVLFVGAGSLLAQDNANFFWDDTNNFLGIGNAIPDRGLTITGTIIAGLSLKSPASNWYLDNRGAGGSESLAFFGPPGILEHFRLLSGGGLQLSGKIFPGTDGSALQAVSGIFAGNGVPNNANGANGDFYFQGDGTQAGNTLIYHKEAGAWVALITT